MPQVVQTGKNTLLRDFQTACHYRELEEIIALQCPAVEVADQLDHIVAVAEVPGLVQGHIVLVNQEGGLLAIVLI